MAKKHHIAEKYRDIIVTACLNSASSDPLKIACEIMDDPNLRMHGPEHHFLVAAALMTAYVNRGHGDPDLEQQLGKLYHRMDFIPAGACAFYGICGVVMGVGAFFGLTGEATPFSKKGYRRVNEITSHCQNRVAAHEGPRCCKRMTFACILEAEKYLDEDTGAETDRRFDGCRYSTLNPDCHGAFCPFFYFVPRRVDAD